MNPTNDNKWPVILFFLTSGFFFFGCVWYLWASSVNPIKSWTASRTADASPSSTEIRPSQATIQLTKDHGAEIDGSRIVYRGRHDGTLDLDLYILALDPHCGYPLHIPEASAREGFSIGSQYFRLLAASSGRIRLQRL